MAWHTARLIGRRIPDANVAEYVDDAIVTHSMRELLAGARSIVTGMPGAYTPVCTMQHVPNLIANAERFAASGFTGIYCLVTSDPFSLAAWARSVDPQHKVRFLSDGNLDFCGALGLISNERDLFMGRRSCRYTLVTEGDVMRAVRVEESVLDFHCTRAELAIDDIGPVTMPGF